MTRRPRGPASPRRPPGRTPAQLARARGGAAPARRRDPRSARGRARQPPEPHADLDGHAVRAEDTLGVLRDRLLHPQRRVARPDCVVLVGQRRSEERHDPVAHDLVDGALVAVDGLHHPFEHRIEQLPRLLGITVGEQFHRALVRSAKSTVTCLRSPSRALLEVKIFSARCLGVYVSGEANLGPSRPGKRPRQHRTPHRTSRPARSRSRTRDTQAPTQSRPRRRTGDPRCWRLRNGGSSSLALHLRRIARAHETQNRFNEFTQPVAERLRGSSDAFTAGV
jgi:hypothetical protein